mmetsp:Transcript_26744/g.39559  ORF Transcript_26744/g.39559 Transcript_26744/m.39559 type:complete len:389 (-) Transcript_26744:111-1277(-)|eukprot:CAMPEP_0194222638 /NCGR_PEP_ID=MMETSP0156-20130528/33414_1 /TAXON_ID=33649 /ORGANISM="Thalassionema nitzschioides, Strain L26-B" /LENGTH=388 /DNA_ID=CAMNT_0038953513 /DNA_START=79 /DNA_END=1245 /DNA_ORIENTATION=+
MGRTHFRHSMHHLSYRQPLNDGTKDINHKAKSGPVTYDSKNWFQVLFQSLGSIWPQVIPFCFVNVVVLVGLFFLKEYDVIDLTMSGQAHGYAAMLVSFLLVQRVTRGLNRYNQSRGYINLMYQETRELIQDAIIYSSRNDDEACKEWRMEISYRTLLLLRTGVAVLEYNTKVQPAWELPELSGSEKDYATPHQHWDWHACNSDPGNRWTNTMRVPFRLAYLLRESIYAQESRLAKPIHIIYESKLLACVDDFMKGYYGITQFITTPVPFPLIQMTRTILVLYLFSLPFVFLNSDDHIIECVIAIFFLTFGFMGLELVAIELDDPFGDDENDFDALAFARMVFEDAFLMIHENVGREAACELRDRMTDFNDTSLEDYQVLHGGSNHVAV